MDGKIVLNLAISLDGYIADENGGFDWIKGQGDSRLDTEKQFDFYKDFLPTIDVVVMGKTCYDQGLHKDFLQKKVYVATSKEIEDDSVQFIHEDVVNCMVEEKQKGNRVYLFGGGILADEFMKQNVIDEYSIAIFPIILGKGKPLFLGGNAPIPLQLNEYFVGDGIVTMNYSKRQIMDM